MMADREKMNSEDDVNQLYDITFIGAGPVALYGMYYAGLRLMSVKAIEMLEEVGGGLMALYPDKYIYDVAGFPKVLAKDLVQLLEKQATQYPYIFCLGEKVTMLERQEDETVKLTTTKGVHYSKTVIICAGLGAYIPKRLDVPIFIELDGHGVFFVQSQSRTWTKLHEVLTGPNDITYHIFQFGIYHLEG